MCLFNLRRKRWRKFLKNWLVSFAIRLRIAVYCFFGSVVWYQDRCQSRSAIQVWLWVIASLEKWNICKHLVWHKLFVSLLPSCNRGMILVIITIWFFPVDMRFNSLKLATSLFHIVRRTSLDLQKMIVLYIFFAFKNII